MDHADERTAERTDGRILELAARLIESVNGHDLDRIVGCFAESYVNETPAHPDRGFQGREQVRKNWTQILTSVPDLHAQMPRIAVDGDVVWTEWEMKGTRPDGAPFAMCGVVIFGVADEAITSARFYLEPVEQTSGDVDTHTRRVLGTAVADDAVVAS